MPPVYKQLALGLQMTQQLSGLNPLSLCNNENYKLEKVEFSFCDKCEIVVKLTIHENSAVSKAWLGKF